jgi:hypothetical protein
MIITITTESHHHGWASRRRLLPSPPQLVEQQGEIQPAPTALLGDRHVSHRGLNLPKGLAMLRHKLRVL